jgi:hypothetical protein
MPDITGPPLEAFAAGFNGRVESTLREVAQATYFNLTSVDSNVISAAQNSQLNGYQIQAAYTLFTSVAVGGAAVLPQTSRPFPLSGLLVYVTNTGANPLSLFAHPNDTGNSINGLGANVPVILGANTTTPFQCQVAGQWFADGIGEGFSGSIATTVSQGAVAAAGTTQSAAVQINQAMVQVTGTTGGVMLPLALAGLQIIVNAVGSSGSLNVYPINGGTDHINALANNTAFAVSLPVTAPTIFYSFVNGSWTTK